ncbi:hypothetical protein D3C81_1274440 [compost metagenome]
MQGYSDGLAGCRSLRIEGRTRIAAQDACGGQRLNAVLSIASNLSAVAVSREGRIGRSQFDSGQLHGTIQNRSHFLTGYACGRCELAASYTENQSSLGSSGYIACVPASGADVSEGSRGVSAKTECANQNSCEFGAGQVALRRECCSRSALEDQLVRQSLNVGSSRRVRDIRERCRTANGGISREARTAYRNQGCSVGLSLEYGTYRSDLAILFEENAGRVGFNVTRNGKGSLDECVVRYSQIGAASCRSPACFKGYRRADNRRACRSSCELGR